MAHEVPAMHERARHRHSPRAVLLRLVALTRKEVRQLLRDKSILAIGLLLPVMLMLLFGYGLSLDVRNAPIAVVMEDASRAAIDAVVGLQLSPFLSPVMLTSMHEAEALMLTREVDGIVRVPGDFSRAMAAGEASIQVIVHGTEASRASIILNYLTATLAQQGIRRIDRSALGNASGIGSVDVESRLWFNEANTSTWYLVPGLIVLIITLVGAFLTALVMAREWERGTFEALFVSPVKPVEILLAKIIPYFCVGIIGLTMCLVTATSLFAVPIQGSLPILLFASVLYLLVALGIGLLISSVTRNQFMASQVSLLASLLPVFMLSGFMFDLRNVPAAINIIGHLLPATHFMSLIKSLMLAGNVWPQIILECSILAAYAVLFIGLARMVTRKRLD
jgi:ABC-2 type transport system permease protein